MNAIQKYVVALAAAVATAALLITATVTPAPAQDIPAGHWVIRAQVSAHSYPNWWKGAVYLSADQCEGALANDPTFRDQAEEFIENERDAHGPQTVVTFSCWTPGDPSKDI